jgi:hypothetical protein
MRLEASTTPRRAEESAKIDEAKRDLSEAVAHPQTEGYKGENHCSGGIQLHTQRHAQWIHP